MSDDRTEELLATLELDVGERAFFLVNAARTAGIPLVVISARRSVKANRDVQGAAKSFHLSGRAFDVAVLGYRRDEIPYEWWQNVGQWAEVNLGLRWGGRFRDVNHFDGAWL